MFIGKYNKSVILTYIGLFFSCLGIYLVYNQNINFAIICLILAGICDLFDGKIARLCKRNNEEKQFGIQLDSLSDVVSFLILPSVIGICLFKNFSLYYNLVFVIYIIAGIIRLSWFNIITTTDKIITYYRGLPVTFVALILPIVYLIDLYLDIYNLYLYFPIFLILSFLFVFDFKFKKPNGIYYVIFSLLALITIFLILCKSGI